MAPKPLDIFVAARRRIIDNGRTNTAPQQGFRQVTSDKSQTAGNDGFMDQRGPQ